MRKFITIQERNKSSFPGHYSFDLDNKCGRYCTNKKPGHPRYDGQYDRLRLVNVQTAFEKPKTFSSFTISHIILKGLRNKLLHILYLVLGIGNVAFYWPVVFYILHLKLDLGKYKDLSWKAPWAKPWKKCVKAKIFSKDKLKKYSIMEENT